MEGSPNYPKMANFGQNLVYTIRRPLFRYTLLGHFLVTFWGSFFELILGVLVSGPLVCGQTCIWEGQKRGQKKTCFWSIIGPKGSFWALLTPFWRSFWRPFIQLWQIKGGIRRPFGQRASKRCQKRGQKGALFEGFWRVLISSGRFKGASVGLLAKRSQKGVKKGSFGGPGRPWDPGLAVPRGCFGVLLGSF